MFDYIRSSPNNITYSLLLVVEDKGTNFINAYLSKRPRSDTNSIQHPQWDHECRRESEKSSDSITPPGVLISVVEFEWCVLNQGKD